MKAILTHRGKGQCNIAELGYQDCLISDVYKHMGKSGVPPQYFISDYTDTYLDIKDVIRSLSFPYLRRCALLWKVINSSMPMPFSHGAHVLESSSHAMDVTMGYETDCSLEELTEVEELEKMFKIPPGHVVLRDKVLRSLASKWLHHFTQECEVRSLQCTPKLTPAVPYKLMVLPHLYQDLLQRYASWPAGSSLLILIYITIFIKKCSLGTLSSTAISVEKFQMILLCACFVETCAHLTGNHAAS